LELLVFLRANFEPMSARPERGGMRKGRIYLRTKAIFKYFELPFGAQAP
jgi:hypothetical protein